MRFRLRVAAAAATAVACTGLGLTGVSPADAVSSIQTGNPILNYLPEAGTKSTQICLRGPNTSGNDVTIQVCDGSQYQSWHWTSAYYNNTFLQLANGYDLCLSVQGGSSAQGAHVTVSTCKTGHQDQYWEPVLNGECTEGYMGIGGFYPFLNEGSGMVLNVKDGSMKPGTDLTIWPDAFKCGNQDWGGAEW